MTFIRPLYTCGAFNRKVQRAVMYNTARGTCYTFEDVSANKSPRSSTSR